MHEDLISNKLTDACQIGFPGSRHRLFLVNASAEQLKKVNLRGAGTALHCKELEDDLTITGIVEERFQLSLKEYA